MKGYSTAPQKVKPVISDEVAELSRTSDERERDVFLTGALAVLSGCLPHVWGRYDTRRYAPNLYTFVIAPAGSGKSALNWARKLGKAVHDQLRRESAGRHRALGIPARAVR